MMEMRELDRRWQELEDSPRPSAALLQQYLKMVRPARHILGKQNL